MIKVTLYKQNQVCMGFSVTGHAGYADYGQDIVCAGVTSAVQLTINGITEILKVPADVEVEDNLISIRLSDGDKKAAVAFLEAFALHVSLLSQDYQGTIQLTDTEV